MKEKKSLFPIIGLLALYIIAFNVIAFLAANDFTGQFWSGYAFITVSWINCVVSVYFGFKSAVNGGVKTFLAIPQVVYSIIYLLVQLVVGIVVMVIPNFSITVSIILQIVILTLYLAIVFGILFYKSKSVESMDTRKAQTSFKNRVFFELTGIQQNVTAPSLLEKVALLRECLQYSDPVSSPETEKYEMQFMAQLLQLKSDVTNKEDLDLSIETCDSMLNILTLRNEACAMAKQH